MYKYARIFGDAAFASLITFIGLLISDMLFKAYSIEFEVFYTISAGLLALILMLIWSIYYAIKYRGMK